MSKVCAFLAVALALSVSASVNADDSLCHQQRSCIHLTAHQCANGERSVCITWKTDGCYKGSIGAFPHVCSKDGEVTTTQSMWAPSWENRICVSSKDPVFVFAVGDESDCNGAFTDTEESNGDTATVQCAPAYPAIEACGGEKRQCIWKLTMPECDEPTTPTPTKLPSPTPTKSPTKLPSPTPIKQP